MRERLLRGVGSSRWQSVPVPHPLEDVSADIQGEVPRRDHAQLPDSGKVLRGRRGGGGGEWSGVLCVRERRGEAM